MGSRPIGGAVGDARPPTVSVLTSIPSEIKPMEAIDFELLYRWFLAVRSKSHPCPTFYAR